MCTFANQTNKMEMKDNATIGQRLPAYDIAEQLNNELRAHHAAVVVAPPGAGKSTLLPLTILKALPSGNIVMLEPRRLAARQVAMRMAQMLGEDVGETVGYQIRFERRLSAKTRIEVVTEGILTRRMVDDPTLEDVACIIFDEFHERSLQSDVALCLARQIKDILRPELNLVVMSATIDAKPISAALGAEVIACQGRMFPVEVVQAKEDCDARHVAETVAAVVSRVHGSRQGDILAFLPGQADIVRCAELLGQSLAPTQVYPLYGNLPPRQQQMAIAPSGGGERKVVLATPIAETSLTIEGVRIVVDSGYCRKLVFDPSNGLSHLETVRISHDMALQRTGRAGRVAPGVCYRLWTTATDHRMEQQRHPEIVDADLAPMALSIATFGQTDIASLPWLTPPPAANLQRALAQLRLLRALDGDGQATALGRRMAMLPCHPRIARMMLMPESSGGESLAFDIAAILEEKDVMGAESPMVGANLAARVAALREARDHGTLGRWARVAKVAAEYARMVGRHTSNAPVAAEDVGALVAAAYPERVAMAMDHNGNYRLAGGGQVALDAGDPLTGHQWLAVASLHAAGRGRGRVFMAAPVRPADLDPLASWQDNLTWITHQGGLVARSELRLGALVMESRPIGQTDPEKWVDIVCAAVEKEGLSLLDWNPTVAQLQLRVALVARWHPELSLPDLSTEHLLANPEEWLGFYLRSGNHVLATVAELRRIDLAEVLWNQLNYEQQQALDRLAPVRLRVPSGSMIRVDYRMGSEAPVLSVRLQECFGLADTPCVDGGRVPVLMELLSPGFKPLQLTTDLRHFWQSTYFEVRKELRRRYPKHYWPDDPLSAEAVRGVRRSK